MNIVELRPAFSWTCESCGRDHTEGVPSRPLDPGNPDERMQIVSHVEEDLNELWSAAGASDTDIFPPEVLRKLDDVMMAAVGSSVERYKVKYLPLEVTCRVCKETFRTQFGDQVLSDLEDDFDDEDDLEG